MSGKNDCLEKGIFCNRDFLDIFGFFWNFKIEDLQKSNQIFGYKKKNKILAKVNQWYVSGC